MKNLLILVFLVSCVNSLPNKEPVTELPEVVVSIQETPQATKVFELSVSTKNITEEQTNRFFKLSALATKVLNDPELKERMLKAWWDGKPGFQDSPDSPEKVVETLLASNILVKVEMRRNSYRSVTAWTFPTVEEIYFNTRNFNSRKDCAVIGTLFHEYSHKKGYRHASSKRSLSVPYYLGTQAVEVCQKNI